MSDGNQMPSVADEIKNHLGVVRDLPDDDLDYLLNNVANANGFTRPLILEIRRHRAMVKRLEAWAESLESCPAGCMPPGDIAYELRNRMRTP